MSTTVASQLARREHGGPTDPAHDARLRRGILDTRISRANAALLCCAFLLLIYGVPIAQAVWEHQQDEESSLSGLVQRAPTQQHLRQFERDVEQASYARDYVQPRVQLLLSRYGRVGNKRAIIGRDGWLFYTPGLQHIVGPSFLDPEVIAQRATLESDETRQPDPRPAIRALARMLARRGIALVLFPVPDKAALQPLQLSGRRAGRERLPVARNPGWPAFRAELQRSGVTLFDPRPRLLVRGEPEHFLQQDTHWTPAWMAQVASALARVVTRVAELPPVREPGYRRVIQTAERVGDLVDMLKLPERQTLFAPRRVELAQVRDAAGELWEPDASADVLLLGDSFTNVFSEDYMGWGEAAGLAPQLAFALGRALDVIAQNDSGAFATRKLLAQSLAAGEDRLAGKRVVIWEFAERELSVGDWKRIAWPHMGARAAAGRIDAPSMEVP